MLYLAHASQDKPFVDRVALQLGRHRVVYDKWTFKAGDSLLEAMQQGLDDSDVFVLFASLRSLHSVWTNYEIDEAEWRLAIGGLRNTTTVILRGELDVKDLPSWLTQTLVITSSNPKHTARALIGEAARNDDQSPTKFFMGRERELYEMASKLAPIDTPPPRVVVMHGLQGVGRRTLLRRAASDYLSLNTLVEVDLLENEGLTELYIKLSDEAKGFETRSDLAQEIAAFTELDSARQAEEVAKLLSLMSMNSESVLVHDRGALLNELGQYNEDSIRLMSALEEYEGVYLFIAQRRRPDLIGFPSPVPLALHQAAPLALNAIEQLLQNYLKRADVRSQPNEIRELAEYMGGYPPAVDLAVTLVKQYGLAVILADKTILVGFLSRTFADALKKIALPKHGSAILKILAAFSYLPLDAISAAVGVQPENLAADLRALMDENLVGVSDAGHYAVSPPVVRGVETVFGRPTTADYEFLGTYLREVHWAPEAPLPDLDVIDATLVSIARSDSTALDEFGDVILPSMIERYAEQCYHNKDWTTAKSLAQRALDADSNRHRARRILFQAYVRESEWPQAESVLQDIQANNRKDRFYLEGFMLWKRGDLNGAVTAFEDAAKSGHRSPSVQRDRAHCLFRLGRISEAWDAVRQADQHFGENRFVLDLAAQIAIAKREYSAAAGYIDRLERLDYPENVAHRRATLLIGQGRLQDARREAERAIDTANPRFEAIAQLCDIYVRLDDDRAERAIQELKPGNNTHYKDVQLGLEVKRLLRDGHHRRAALQWAGIRNQGLPVHNALWAEILRQRIDDLATSLVERIEAEAELSSMGIFIDLPLSVDEASDDFDMGA